MKRINSIEELLTLNPKEDFYVVSNGNVKPYIFASPHPMHKEIAVAISGGDYMKAVCFNVNTFKYAGTDVILSGKYSSKEIGEIIIEQLKEKSETIREIYINSKQ